MQATIRKLHPEIRRLIDELLAEGWTWQRTGGGHIKVTHPTGRCCFAPLTPSDWRAVRNFTATVRRLQRELA